ncbi:MarR family winged helix-turn-helix transcriptional regulator [Bosea sp. (in: a-proteobacteria)]|uniref:MarR family winged helix-turn-helix transcriptional regulator n=1 Tax=Bosea sp. (in: a-proteobacteria) TaxID=1871050 RepID=UPI00260F389B|nr:MarR family transcriptional regulator [Bosea sp. (in: a-proteobacteria)]MCO5093300.1 MarR family transcriptional regulator [Bosea sp. (in: a-proteobacteria)]
MDPAEDAEDGLGRHHRLASGRADSAVPEPVDLAGYVLDEQFGFLLRQIQQRYVAMFLEMMGPDGPTPPQFATLCRLAADGRISQNQLGRMTAMDPATIRGVVTRLEERGLVERLNDPDDKRRVLVQLSPRGREQLPGYIVRAKAITIAALDPMEAQEVTPLLDLMRRLLSGFRAPDTGAAPPRRP